VFALILTVGAALHQLLDTSEYGRIPSLFYSFGLFAVPFLPETQGKPLPEPDTLSLPQEQVRKTA
jgi:hypothetical protein